MSDHLAHSLTRLADRGQPRGAAAVLGEARRQVAAPTPRQPQRRSLHPAFAIAAILLVTVGGLIVLQMIRSDSTPTDDPTPTTTTPPTTVPGPTTLTPGAADDVSDLALAPDGKLWAATAAGVVVWDIETATPTVFSEADGLGGRSVDHIAVAADGTAWALGDSWLAHYNGAWTRIGDDVVNADILSPFGDMTVGPDGAVWIAVGGPNALIRVDTDGSTTYAIPETGMETPWAWSIAVDGDGTVWASCGEAGLLAFDGDWHRIGVDDGLQSDLVSNIVVAADGSVWAGGGGEYGASGAEVPAGGIARYDGSTWTTFTTVDGLLSDSGEVTTGAGGHVWVIHGDLGLPENGVSRFDGTTWVTYPGGYGGGDAGVVTADGTIWTASKNGIVGFDGSTSRLLIAGAQAVPPLAPQEFEPVAGLEPVRLSTSIGEIEFTTWTPPGGGEPPWWPTESVDGIVANLHDLGFAASSDGVMWTPVPDPDDPIHTALARGKAATGPRGSVMIDGERVDFSADGTEFAEASQPPDKTFQQEPRAGGCTAPGWTSGGIMASLGPLVATEDGFVVLAARSQADWYRDPVCEPIAWLSTDGNRWTPATDESPFGERAFVFDIAAVGGRIVAVGGLSPDVGGERSDEAAVWVSDDGIDWQRSDLEAAQVWQVAGSARGWIAVGNHLSRSFTDLGGDMWFSPDGLVWDGPYERPPGWADAQGILGVAMLDDLIVGTGERLNVMPADAPPAGVVVGVFADE